MPLIMFVSSSFNTYINLPKKKKYTEYEVSIDSKMVCIWFTKSSVSTAELNLELKP